MCTACMNAAGCVKEDESKGGTGAAQGGGGCLGGRGGGGGGGGQVLQVLQVLLKQEMPRACAEMCVTHSSKAESVSYPEKSVHLRG